MDCDEEWIEESARTFGQRLKEDFSVPFPLYNHANTTGYHTRVDNISNVGREPLNIARTINEAMYIRVNDPSLSRTLASSIVPYIGLGPDF